MKLYSLAQNADGQMLHKQHFAVKLRKSVYVSLVVVLLLVNGFEIK